MLTIKILLLLTAAATALYGCSTNSIGESASTKVEGLQDSVIFSWQQDHPWSTQFSGQGSRFSLFAQYVANGRPVEQNLGRPSSVSSQQWTFALPRELRSVPESQVCLFFSQSQTSPSIPVRARAAVGGETARFRFPDWEKRVIAATSTSVLEAELKAIDSIVADSKAQLARLKGDLERSGVKSIEDCSRLASAVSSTQYESIPADVVPVAMQMDATERICVRRARNMKRFRPEYRADLDVLAEQVSTDTTVALTERTRSQVRSFLNQWMKWRDRTGPEYTPQLGSPTEGLPTGGVLDEAIKVWNSSAAPKTSASRATITAGLLDAYSGCLEDVSKQLAIRGAAWESARVNRPARDRLFAERRRAQCHSQVSGLEALASSIVEQENQLTVRRANQPPAGRIQLEVKQTRPVALNTLTCNL